MNTTEFVAAELCKGKRFGRRTNSVVAHCIHALFSTFRHMLITEGEVVLPMLGTIKWRLLADNRAQYVYLPSNSVRKAVCVDDEEISG
jgi:hypothetical protein